MIVVTLIIAALATLTITGASTVFDRARKTQAKNDETQIVTAVNAYYTEYGKYPMADARQGTDTLFGKSNTAPGNEDVFNVLRAISKNPDGTDTVDVNDTLNPRKIIFFSGKDGGSRPRSAFATVATTDTQGKPINIGAFADPYGNAYMVAIDASYDEPQWTLYLTLTSLTHRAHRPTRFALAVLPNRLVRMVCRVENNRMGPATRSIAAQTTFFPGNESYRSRIQRSRPSHL